MSKPKVCSCSLSPYSKHSSMNTQVILVDTKDKPIGQMEKLEAHKKGLLHRALSVFIFNSEGKMLIQRRALSKYHTPGLWSNTACSHPMLGEETIDAARRRLKQEMGLSTNLTFSFSFIYKASFDNGLIENELDHVFLGFSDDSPCYDVEEVCDYKYISPSDLLTDIVNSPQKYTPWLKICLDKVLESKYYLHKNALIA